MNQWLLFEIFHDEFIEIDFLDEIGRQKHNPAKLREIHNMMPYYKRRCLVEAIAPLAYVVGEIRISEFFVSVHRRLFYYFIVPKDLYPQSDHAESIPQKTIFFKRFIDRGFKTLYITVLSRRVKQTAKFSYRSPRSDK